MLRIWKACLIFAVLFTACSYYKPLVKSDIDLIMLDDIVKTYIGYAGHRRTRDTYKHLGAVVDLVNLHRERDVAVDWQFAFYDLEGFEIEKTAWNTVVIPKQQRVSIKTNSMSQASADFKVYIRESAN